MSQVRLKAVGLDQPDTTNASLTMWRGQMVEELAGFDAAVRISGRTPENYRATMTRRINPYRKAKQNQKNNKSKMLDIA